MASKGIKGITIQIRADTKPLEGALKDVNKQSKNLQSELKEVERGLKFDPSNVELLRQKQQLLTRTIEATSDKLHTLRQAQGQVEAQFRRGEIGEEQYRAFRRELVNTESQMRDLQSQVSNLNTDQQRLAQTNRRLSAFFDATNTNVEQFADTLGTRLTQSIRNGTASADQMERALRLMGRQALGASTDIDEMRRILNRVNEGGSIDDVRNELQQMNRVVVTAQDELKEVDKLLKLNPNNVELLAQKQRLLNRSISDTSTELQQLQQRQSQVEAQFRSGQLGEQEYRAFQRQIEQTEQSLRGYQNQLDQTNREQDQVRSSARQLQTLFDATGTSVDQFADVIGNDLTRAIQEGRATSAQLEQALERIGRSALGSGTDLEQMRTVLRNIDNGVNIDEIRLELERLSNSADQTNQHVKKLNETLSETGDKMKEVGSSTTVGSAGILGFGTGAGIAASQFEDASAKIQMSLGTTDEKTQELLESAKKLWKDGYGESLEEVENGLIRVRQNIQSISDGAELETLTRNALLLAKTFDADVNEVTRAANNLMINFGVTSEEAFDLLARGAQEGLNFSNELFDNTAEYAGLWSTAGFTADEYFDVLKNGTREGVYNLDYLNDVVKEFNIRVKDGSKSTSDSMALMSKDTQKVWKSFQDGESTVSDVFYKVLNELEGMDDQILASQIGVGLFGTKFEDLETYAMYALGSLDGGLSDVTGSMEKLAEVQDETFSKRWTSMTREAAASLEPVGLILLDFVERWLPKIIELIKVVANWFANLSPVIQILMVSFGALVAVLGPLIIIIGAIVSSIGTLIPLFASGGAVATGFGAVMAALTGPIGIAILAITGIVTALVTAYNKVDWFREGVNQIWNTIKDYTSTAFKAVKDLLTSLILSGVDFAKGILDKFKAFWDENGQAITESVQKHFGKIKANIEMVMGIIKGIFEIVWPFISNLIKVVWEGIQLTISNTLDIILGIIQTVMKLVQGDWKGAWESIKGIAENIMNNIIKFFKDIDLQQIGKDVVSGFVKGIGSMVGAVKKKVEELAANIPEWAKKVLGIHSPSRVMAEVGKWIPAGLAQGIENNSKTVEKVTKDLGQIIQKVTRDNANEVAKIADDAEKERTKIQNDAAEKRAALKKKDAKKIAQIDKDMNEKLAKVNEKAWNDMMKKEGQLAKERLEAIQSYIDDKKSLEQIGALEEIYIWDNQMKLFKEGTTERIKAQQNYKKALETVNKEIVSINQSYQSKMQTINDNLIQNINKENDAFNQAYSSRVEAIRNFKGMFDEFVANTDRSGQDLLNNLQSQVSGLQTWRDTLASLWTKIDDQSLMEELEALGPNALGELQALNNMSDEQLNQYVGLYNTKFALAREQASLELSGMKEDTVMRIEEMKKAANEELSVLQTEWNQAIKNVTKATSNELTSLRQIGNDAGRGLLDGLASMQGPLISKAQEIANSISKTIQTALDIHSPSRVMKGFGVNIGQGLVIGMDDMISKVAQSSARLSDAVVNAQASLASSASKSRGYASNTSTTSTTVDKSTSYNPTFQIYTVESPEKVIKREMRKMVFSL